MYVPAHDVVVHYASLGHQVRDCRESEHECENHLYIYPHVIKRGVSETALVVGVGCRAAESTADDDGQGVRVHIWRLMTALASSRHELTIMMMIMMMILDNDLGGSHRPMGIIVAGRFMRSDIALAAEEGTQTIEHEHHRG